ncbi:MAG: AMP-binding protein [Angelakisella sp.]|jgi:acetyl-CoA synthetase|nr:AMP-binding protein [Angelakisella sp.]
MEQQRMDLLYQRFCQEEFDKNGVLCKFRPVVPEDFNFAYDCVDYIARHQPDRRAMVWCDDLGHQRTFTFGDMSRYSNMTANLLLQNGVKRGDMVMVILKRHYQFWFTILALHKIGAVIIPATNLLTKKDVVYRVNAARVSAIVCTADGEVSQAVEDGEPEFYGPVQKFLVHGGREGWLDFDRELESCSPVLERIPNKASDPMLLYFSSGTTGYPKMVVHDHSYAIAHIVTARHWHNVVPDGLHLTVADTGWGKAVWGKLYGQWLCGAGVFVYDYTKFAPKDLLQKIQQYRITTFCAPPTIYRFFIKEGMEGYDLSSLTYATTAGEALNPEVYNRFLDYTGLRLMEGFGQTETVLSLANLVNSTPKPGSMGKPSPLYHVEVVDSEGVPVSTGEVGEIVIRADGPTPGLLMEYYQDPERTKEAWHDGWYHTGDTVWQDEDGYFWYVGRTDDVIKASGYRIGPFEIESVLMEHPAVLECAVTGAPDPIRGTVVKATIVLMKGYQPTPELTKELQDYVKHQTAPYKYPRIVEYVEELPKTISGKIRRVAIREKGKQ